MWRQILRGTRNKVILQKHINFLLTTKVLILIKSLITYKSIIRFYLLALILHKNEKVYKSYLLTPETSSDMAEKKVAWCSLQARRYSSDIFHHNPVPRSKLTTLLLSLSLCLLESWTSSDQIRLVMTSWKELLHCSGAVIYLQQCIALLFAFLIRFQWFLIFSWCPKSPRGSGWTGSRAETDA